MNHGENFYLLFWGNVDHHNQQFSKHCHFKLCLSIHFIEKTIVTKTIFFKRKNITE